MFCEFGIVWFLFMYSFLVGPVDLVGSVNLGFVPEIHSSQLPPESVTAPREFGERERSSDIPQCSYGLALFVFCMLVCLKYFF